MAHVISLTDGSVHTCLSERDFYDLVDQYMGMDAKAYLEEIIEDTALLVQDSADERYEELEGKYEALKNQYEALKEQYSDLRYERGRW